MLARGCRGRCIRACPKIGAPGWRRVSVTKGKTRIDWAHQIRQLLDVDYADADKVHLVQDNLNTQNGASFYEAFAPLLCSV